jgi:hypothetical protein
MPYKSTRTLIHHFTSSPLLQKRKPQSHGGQRQATHQEGQHPTKEAHHSRVSFLLTCFLLSFAILCLPLLVFSSLDLLPEEILGTEETPEYISSDSSLEEEDATQNRGSITSCAAAFGIWSMICETSPPAAMPNANAA